MAFSMGLPPSSTNPNKVYADNTVIIALDNEQLMLSKFEGFSINILTINQMMKNGVYVNNINFLALILFCHCERI